jgi:hypothetical protein
MAPTGLSHLILKGWIGRGERIRTSGLLVPNQALYQAEPRPDYRKVHSILACSQSPKQQNGKFAPGFG